MLKNCWEFKNCGREKNGFRSRELGVCPEYTCSELNEVHHGMNAGRTCWIIAGTLCHGDVQGTFAKKFSTCKECDFYHTVQAEEYPRFKLAATLLHFLNEKKPK